MDASAKGKRPEKYTDKESEIDAEGVSIQFGPEVLTGLKRLEKAVRGKEDFDDDLHALLKNMASGKPVLLKYALSWLTRVGEETAQYAQATGDQEASLALLDVVSHLNGLERGAKPVSVFAEPKASLGRHSR